MSNPETPKPEDAGTSKPVGVAPPASCSAPSITVSGVTFTADQVESAVVKIDGRKIHITERTPDEKRIGFQ